MSKIYVFAIGGTGSRVLKALTMLLAAGVEIDKTNISEIVPIIIDPDAACGDKDDTSRLMDQYAAIYDTLNHHDDSKLHAFATKLGKPGFQTGYMMPIGTNTNSQFGTYMNFGTLPNEANKALVNMLFSDENQSTDMTIGFLGNPNIGSVVLNQFSSSPDFQQFAGTFNPGDKIFIISSIFGGTGASGFPLLLKNFRDMDPGIPNSASIQQAEIGAITVLPYFNIDKPKDDGNGDGGNKGGVDSNTFISKTKAALSYYEHNLKNLNVLYYIGDLDRGAEDYNPGGAVQRNDAHFVELAAALSVIDFANNSYAPSQPGAAVSTTYKEFGIDNGTKEMTFNDLNDKTRRQIRRPLTEFTLFSKYLHEELKNSTSQTWIKPYTGIRNTNTGAFDALKKFTESFLNWEKEMASKAHHARCFSPFVLEARPDDVFGLVKGIKPKKVYSTSSKNWNLYNHFLNGLGKEANQEGKTNEGRFIAHLLYGTQNVVSKKLGF